MTHIFCNYAWRLLGIVENTVLVTSRKSIKIHWWICLFQMSWSEYTILMDSHLVAPEMPPGGHLKNLEKPRLCWCGAQSMHRFIHLLQFPNICSEYFRYFLTSKPTVLPQYKDAFFVLGNFHYEDNADVRPSYLYNEIPDIGKSTYLYWDGPLVFGMMWNGASYITLEANLET